MRLVRSFVARLKSFIERPSSTETSAAIDFRKLSTILDYPIIRPDLFTEALTHSSYLQTAGREDVISNERLEFLGDSVLNLVIAELLFRNQTTAPEGELTKIRSRIVNRKALAVYAQQLNLIEFIMLSPSASQLEGRGLETILADSFEAIVGAIYLDGGYLRAQHFVERMVRETLDRGILNTTDENFKSRLLEYAQAEGLGPPRYVTIREEGPDHDRVFTVEVIVGGRTGGIGRGKNKKDAEQSAAEDAMQKLQHETGSNVPEQ